MWCEQRWDDMCRNHFRFMLLCKRELWNWRCLLRCYEELPAKLRNMHIGADRLNGRKVRFLLVLGRNMFWELFRRLLLCQGELWFGSRFLWYYERMPICLWDLHACVYRWQVRICFLDERHVLWQQVWRLLLGEGELWQYCCVL